MKNTLKNIPIFCKTVLAMSILATGVGIYADDTEVFYSVNVSKPNLLFVLDISGSMGGDLTGSAVTETVDQSISHVSADSRQSRTVTTTSTGKKKKNTTTVVTLGSNSLNDNSIGLGEGSMARFRFKDLGIPEDSFISNAYIQFEAATPADATENNTDAKFRIFTQREDDAPLVENGGVDTYGTVTWEPNGGWTQGDRGTDQRTPDISSLISQVVARNSWNDDNGLAVYITSQDGESGKRWVNTYDNVSNGAAATLHVEYSGGDSTKLQVMKDSLRTVLESAPDNVKVGVMNYGKESYSSTENEDENHFAVSGVAFPVTDINAKAREVIPTSGDLYGLPNSITDTTTVREYIADIADDWNATSWTPIVDSLYEAALYMRGEKMHYGQTLPTKNGAHPSTHEGSAVTTDMELVGRDRAAAQKYISPIESSCQENYIVLMTDGYPTYNTAYDGLDAKNTKGPFARIRNQTDGPQGTLAAALSPTCASPVGVENAGTCGAELTAYLATHDNLPDPTSAFPTGQPGDQYIKTFTIGFGTGAGTNTENYLKSLATYDDGNSATNDDGYFEASTPEALAAAFADILAEVAAPKGTLASPGYSVNVKNGLEHEKDIFIPVFDRKNTSRWSGNLKKFKLVDINNKRIIKGKNDLKATDELGNFTFDALDMWSESPANDPDGRDVYKGGVANLLDPDNRKIFSNLTGNSNVSLNTTANKLDLNNISNLDNATLGLPSGATLDYRKKIVSFMRGWKNGVTDSSATPPPEKRFHMGDMLHSEPLVLTYNSGKHGATKLQYIFAGTNEGYMHAFNAETGEEKFAFIPKELLGTLSEPQFLNAGTQQDHKYGVDGAITGDFIGGADGIRHDGDQIIIYFGLRRGGTTYYALDVTNIDSPVLLWKKSASEHPSMGQSWSTPYVATVGDSSGQGQAVVMVSGGYDDDEDRDVSSNSDVLDDSTTSVTADVGNDLLIFNSLTGDLVWSMPAAMRSQITSSIAGGIRPLDTNNNNLIDRVYFGDTGGNVWRLDLSEKIGDSTKPSTLIKIASLGGTGINARKFYNEPDVALMRLNGRSVYAVSIGSGFRPHPMDTVIDDNFYVLIDDSPFNALDTTGDNPYTTITETTLAVINITHEGVVSKINSIKDADKRGWLINLPENGEKVLGDATAVNGVIVFPTLVPEILRTGVGIDQCAAPAIFSRIFALDILTGSAISLTSGDGTVTDTGLDAGTGPGTSNSQTPAFSPPQTTEIISKITKVFNTPEPNSSTGCEHRVDLRVGKKSSQSGAYNACRLDSVYWSDPVDTGE